MDYNSLIITTITELPEYIKRADTLLSKSERKDIIDYLSEHPKAGDIMEATGGIRKIRWSRGNKGKSGGVRVVYYYYDERIPLYLLTLFERANGQTCQKLTEMRLVDWLQFMLQKRWRIIMSNVFESIAKGLQEAIELNDGKKVAAKTHRPPHVDVAEIRHGLGLTQMEFASKFCISVSTLRHWERGDRNPHGPALALLNVVAKEPQAVMRALG